MNIESSDLDKKINRLAELSCSNPEQFELERKLLIDQVIAEFPERSRRRAYGIQFTLDARLSLTKDPISRMNLMVELLWAQVLRFSQVLNDPEGYLEAREQNHTRATIIPLRPTKH